MPPRRRQTSRRKSGKRSSQQPAPTNPTPRALPPHPAPQQALPPHPPTPPLRRSSRQSTIASSTRLYIKLPPTVPASGQLSTADSEDSDDGGDGDDGDDEDDDGKSDFDDEDNKELRKMVLEYSPRPFHRNMKLCEDGLADLKEKAAEGSVALEEHLRPYPKDEGGYTKTYYERGLWIAVEIPQSVWVSRPDTICRHPTHIQRSARPSRFPKRGTGKNSIVRQDT